MLDSTMSSLEYIHVVYIIITIILSLNRINGRLIIQFNYTHLLHKIVFTFIFTDMNCDVEMAHYRAIW